VSSSGRQSRRAFQWWESRENHQADKQAASRLVATEIYADTQGLASFSAYGRSLRASPQTVEWQAEATILARYANNAEWQAVSQFYANLLNVEHSLTKTCVGSRDARAEVGTTAKLGYTAYWELTKGVVPNIVNIGQDWGCYSTYIKPSAPGGHGAGNSIVTTGWLAFVIGRLGSYLRTNPFPGDSSLKSFHCSQLSRPPIPIVDCVAEFKTTIGTSDRQTLQTAGNPDGTIMWEDGQTGESGTLSRS
jgi:hypothetical protein